MENDVRYEVMALCEQGVFLVIREGSRMLLSLSVFSGEPIVCFERGGFSVDIISCVMMSKL